MKNSEHRIADMGMQFKHLWFPITHISKIAMLLCVINDMVAEQPGIATLLIGACNSHTFGFHINPIISKIAMLLCVIRVAEQPGIATLLIGACSNNYSNTFGLYQQDSNAAVCDPK